MPYARYLSLEVRVAPVAADRGHPFSKPSRDKIALVEGHGVKGDAQAGPLCPAPLSGPQPTRLPNLRQVHLIPSELFAAVSEAGFEIGAGELGENVTTAGLDLQRMPLETLIELGPAAVMELTGLRDALRPDRPLPGLLEKEGALVGGNGPTIQMLCGRGPGRRAGRARRQRAGSVLVHLVSGLTGPLKSPAHDAWGWGNFLSIQL